ncbi:MAG: hypothetical protein ACREMP_01485 [Candidatus Tyrphobacter sp.]
MGLAARVPERSQAAFEELRERLAAHALPARHEAIASAIPALDRLLGGGFPKGGLTTLEGPVGSGRWALAARLLAIWTRRGLAAVLDGGALYPPALACAGVALQRLLVVPATAPIDGARAADVLVRSRLCGVVALDALSLRAAAWSRLAGLAHKNGTLLLVVATQPPPELTSAARLRVCFERAARNELALRIRHERIRIRCSQ